MKIAKRMLFITLALTLTLVLLNVQIASALVGSQGSADGTGGLIVYPNAPGTKYEGPLTIYFLPVEGENYSNGGYDMYLFLRLRKGNDLYGFSNILPDVDPLNVASQQTLIENWIQNDVMGVIYGSIEPLPPALMKSADRVISDNELEFRGCCNEMFFWILDIVIAVQD